MQTESWPGQLEFLRLRPARCAERRTWRAVYTTGYDESGRLAVWAEVPQELERAQLTVRVYEIIDEEAEEEKRERAARAEQKRRERAAAAEAAARPIPPAPPKKEIAGACRGIVRTAGCKGLGPRPAARRAVAFALPPRGGGALGTGALTGLGSPHHGRRRPAPPRAKRDR